MEAKLEHGVILAEKEKLQRRKVSVYPFKVSVILLATE